MGGSAVELLRTMVMIRRFEEAVLDRFNAGEIAGTTHTYIGQEAIATGVCAPLGQADVITSTHRGHGHLIAKGADPRRMMAELYGRLDGTNRGRGGSMHITDLAVGIYGANGLVGAGVPHAVGAIWAKRQAGSDAIGVAFFGDGGINQGVVHEAMNIASVWDVPVVFVCENNQYALTTPAHTMSRTSIRERAANYGFPAEEVDGMNVEDVRAAAAAAIERARRDARPTFLECRGYRLEGHMGAEKVLGLTYRSEAEIAEWMARDPIDHWASVAGIDDDARAAIEAEVDAVIADAIEFARNSPAPDPADAVEFAYADERTGRTIREAAAR